MFDAQLLAGVQRMIPPDRLLDYLRELDRELQLVVKSASTDEMLASRAHKIVSQAGMLGLMRMAQCARSLEDACRSGAGRAEALGQCRTAVADIELYAIPAARLGPAGTA